MYTVAGFGRLWNLILSILRELGGDDSKATSLHIENTTSAHPLPYPHKKSCREWIRIKTGLRKELCAWLPHRLRLCFCLLSKSKDSDSPRNTDHRQDEEGYLVLKM